MSIPVPLVWMVRQVVTGWLAMISCDAGKMDA